ncbi:hypothetical protein ACE10Z_42660 [Bradyrhizobium sp. Pha-3]|uniref:hypothetical protein n=1 Tax=Bradyrhizobium sp. Pha-3 TaxID=208375 RepID=UPI0035D4A746
MDAKLGGEPATLGAAGQTSAHIQRQGGGQVTGATPGTVRHWLKSGLHPVGSRYPTIIRGADLIDFLKRRGTSRKQPCGPGRLYCLRRKEPRRPAFDEVEFWPDGSARGSLRGLCPTCARIMHRRTSVTQIAAAAGKLRVSFPHGDPRLAAIQAGASDSDDPSRLQTGGQWSEAVGTYVGTFANPKYEMT